MDSPPQLSAPVPVIVLDPLSDFRRQVKTIGQQLLRKLSDLLPTTPVYITEINLDEFAETELKPARDELNNLRKKYSNSYRKARELLNTATEEVTKKLEADPLVLESITITREQTILKEESEEAEVVNLLGENFQSIEDFVKFSNSLKKRIPNFELLMRQVLSTLQDPESYMLKPFEALLPNGYIRELIREQALIPLGNTMAHQSYLSTRTRRWADTGNDVTGEGVDIYFNAGEDEDGLREILDSDILYYRKSTVNKLEKTNKDLESIKALLYFYTDHLRELFTKHQLFLKDLMTHLSPLLSNCSQPLDDNTRTALLHYFADVPLPQQYPPYYFDPDDTGPRRFKLYFGSAMFEQSVARKFYEKFQADFPNREIDFDTFRSTHADTLPRYFSTHPILSIINKMTLIQPRHLLTLFHTIMDYIQDHDFNYRDEDTDSLPLARYHNVNIREKWLLSHHLPLD